MALEIDGNVLTSLSERWKDRSEHLDGSEPAVEQEQRRSPSVDLIVVVDAVRRDVSRAHRLETCRGLLGLDSGSRYEQCRDGEVLECDSHKISCLSGS